MSLKASGIDHVNIDVKSLKETIEFYNKLFGFVVLKEQPEHNSKIIGNEKIKMCIYEDPDFNGYVESGFNHFGFHIENFNEIISKCKENGVTINYGGAIGWEKSESIYITDPNGYEIELSRVFGGGL